MPRPQNRFTSFSLSRAGELLAEEERKGSPSPRNLFYTAYPVFDKLTGKSILLARSVFLRFFLSFSSFFSASLFRKVQGSGEIRGKSGESGKERKEDPWSFFPLLPSDCSLQNQEFMMKKETVLTLPPVPGNPRNSEGAFLRLLDNRILFVYSRYCGGERESGDDAPCDLAARISEDGGRTWDDSDRILIPHGDDSLNLMSVSLLRVKPEGRILMVYLRKFADEKGRVNCVPCAVFSEDEGETWTTPVQISGSDGYFVVNNDRLLQLEGGRILVPAAWHRGTAGGHDRRAIGIFFLSDDGGRTFHEASDWILPPQSSGTGLQEPGVVETQPGYLTAFFRTDQGCQMISRSSDGGEHWSTPQPSNFLSPVSPMTLKRDPFDGKKFWAVWNDASGQWKLPSPKESSWKRTPLVLAIGTDINSMTSELLESDPGCGYCYTAMHFEEDCVLLAYCCGGDSPGESVLQKTRIVRISR